jgi:hypothetical protein
MPISTTAYSLLHALPRYPIKCVWKLNTSLVFLKKPCHRGLVVSKFSNDYIPQRILENLIRGQIIVIDKSSKVLRDIEISPRAIRRVMK